MLNRLRRAVQGKRITYAVGGATALAAHGYRRNTRDVDVLVIEKDLPKILRALRGVGLDVFAVFEPSHFAAKLPGDPDPERRIDVLVPYSEPELSAIEFPVKKRKLRMFDSDLLALSKFYALDDSKDPRHGYDLHAMFRRGMFDPRKVRMMLGSVDPERLPAFDELIRLFSAPTQGGPKRRRPEGRIPRGESK